MTTSTTSCAGIGSRQTPAHIQKLTRAVAMCLAGDGYRLRSGGAQGGDEVFSRGTDAAGGTTEWYVPPMTGVRPVRR